MPIEFQPPQANLNYQIPPPQSTDPLQTLAQMGQLRTQGLQQQEAQLGLQQKQLEMQSTQGLMKAYQESGGDLEKMAQLAPKYGVTPDHMAKVQQTFTDLANKRAQTSLFGSEAAKNQQAATDARHDALYNAYQEVWDEKDPLKQQALLQQINPQLLQQGYKPEELIPIGSPQIVQHAKASYTTMGNVKDMAEKQVKEAQALQARAEAGKLTTEQQLTQHKIDLYKTLMQNPDALAKRVAGSIDATKYPDFYNRALNEAKNAPDIAGINSAIEKYAQLASEQEKTIATETDPRVAQARTAQAVATARATAPIETARSVATAVATEKAKAALSPDVFNQIVDPQSRNRAIIDTQKYTNEYITKMNDAQKMLDTVNAAQKGNQAASGLIPLEEIRSIVNRVNRQELEAVSGGGSLLRRVQNMLSQATSGTMSGAQLKDLRALGELQKVGANRAYQGNRLGTKTIYGVMPPEVDLTGIITPAGGGGGGGAPTAAKKGDTKQYQGHTYQYDGAKWVRQ
jgi:hypothetical protein